MGHVTTRFSKLLIPEIAEELFQLIVDGSLPAQAVRLLMTKNPQLKNHVIVVAEYFWAVFYLETVDAIGAVDKWMCSKGTEADDEIFNKEIQLLISKTVGIWGNSQSK